jgi:hypothetical protein
MTLPPPQDPYGPPPQGGGVPSWGGQPQGYGGQYGPPPQGPSSGPPQWGQQPQWAGPPGPPPSKGGRGKWILGGLAVLVVVVLAVVITVLVVRPSGGGPTPTPTNGQSDFASANDTGPVNIIAEDPTCAAWARIANGLVDVEQKAKWPDRDASVPATAWTPEQRSTFESVGQAMKSAGEQATGLAKATPHRVMREIYDQYTAYSQIFADKVATFTPNDNEVAVLVDIIGGGLANICGAITTGSASAQQPILPAASQPSNVSTPDAFAKPKAELAPSATVCHDWGQRLERFFGDTTAWKAISEDIPASQWTPEQKAINDAVAPVMTSLAGDLEKLGRQSNNAVIEDFAVLSAQYRRAYVQALPTYTPADNYLVNASTYLARAVEQGCKVLA